ncbi:MAG: hypothetical protein IPK59_07750 [Rhodospirillaceae bacterium]|nr:hypothetical protein [Rhodospirillaceae bacterium]
MAEQTPPDWGTDKLTAFFDTVRGNQFATFVHKKLAVAKLIEIDACFHTIGENLANNKSQVAALLLLRCHSAFKTAAGHAMAGATVETFVMCRAMLEQASYGLHIHSHADLAEIWLKRHDDDAAMKASKNRFKQADIVASIHAKDSKAADLYERFYQECIDFGAHPNERSVTGALTMEEGEKETILQQVYLQGDGLALDNALKSLARMGLCCLFIFANVFTERYKLLGLEQRIHALRQGL